MITQLLTNPLVFLIWALTLIAAITIHEFAHAYAADKLGDPTPRSHGRLTLNPTAHLDPLGTFLILFFGFGWGRPVMFDPYNLRNPQRDTAIISLAGPLSNIILAIIVSLIYKLFLPLSTFHLVNLIVTLNIMLAVFNLVPVYPLDGEKILQGILPRDLSREFASVMRQYGTIILILLIWPFSGVSPISALITPIIRSTVNFLL